jgi:hypothetical protein
MINWEEEKIINNDYSFYWCSSIVQNDQYVFYATTDYQIVRVDRTYGKKSVIVKLKRIEDDYYNTSIGMSLTKDKLYYIYHNCIYVSDFDGSNINKIATGEELKNVPDKSEPGVGAIEGVQAYNNNIYLMLSGFYVVKFDIETKKVQKIAEDVRSDGCFYKNSFYYFNRDDPAIYKVDLKTLNEEMVRGEKWSHQLYGDDNVKHYKNLVVIQDKLYYVAFQNKEPSTLYLYREDGKDVKKYSAVNDASLGIGDLVSYESIIAYSYYPEDSDKLILKMYDMNTKKEKELHLPDDFYEEKVLIDNILFYSVENGEDEGERLFVWKNESI